MKKTWMGLLAAGFLLAGCGLTKVVVEKAAPNARPDWVNKGGIFQGDNKAVVYGVGIADKGPSLALMREKADSRARADLAAQLKVAVQKLTMDYMSDHKDFFDVKNTAGSDEMTTVVSKQVVDQVLVGTHIIDRWSDPESGALYSLCRMDIGDGLYDSYEQALRRALRSQHRLETQRQMNAALDKLDQAVAAQRQREDQILGATDPAPKVETAQPASSTAAP